MIVWAIVRKFLRAYAERLPKTPLLIRVAHEFRVLSSPIDLRLPPMSKHFEHIWPAETSTFRCQEGYRGQQTCTPHFLAIQNLQRASQVASRSSRGGCGASKSSIDYRKWARGSQDGGRKPEDGGPRTEDGGRQGQERGRPEAGQVSSPKCEGGVPAGEEDRGRLTTNHTNHTNIRVIRVIRG